jgi:hypothetical protein
MTDDGVITTKILLEHIQVNTAAVGKLSSKVDSLSERVDGLEKTMKKGFEEAKQHRDNLQEDLEATISMQFEHKKQLAVLTGGPMPEEHE